MKLIVTSHKFANVPNNQKNVQRNSYVHIVNIRNKDHLHTSCADLSCFQQCAVYTDTFHIHCLFMDVMGQSNLSVVCMHACMNSFNSLPLSLPHVQK
jgi:hypothetical protein